MRDRRTKTEWTVRASIVVASAFGMLPPDPASRLHAQQPEVHADVRPEKVFEGETVRYTVVLENFERAATPELIGFDDFQVRFLGQDQRSSQQITIINGKTNSTVRHQLIYEYALTPRRRGTLIIPAPRVKLGGRTLPGNTLTLEVVEPREQDAALLELTASHEEVYPMQPFQITLRIKVKPIPEPHQEKDPLAVQDPPVQLTIPWGDDKALPDGLVPSSPMERWLEDMLSDRGGFLVNGEPTDRSVFDDMFDRFMGDRRERGRSRGFRPPLRRILHPDANGQRKEYWEYTFSRKFTAKQVGEYGFGPSALKGVLATRVDTRGRMEGEPVYAFLPPLAVRVKDVPTDGRPPSYTGAIGTFAVGADVSPQQVKVGDPMTLTLWLEGQGTLDSTLAPDLNNVAGLAEKFRVYEASEETRDNKRLFTYSLRPKEAGIDEFPSVPLSYFDVDQEQFVTLRSPTIPINVREATRLSTDEIAIAAPQLKRPEPLSINAEGIFANVTDPRQFRDESISLQRWLAGLGSLTGLFIVIALLTQHWQRQRANPAILRRKKAAERALDRMQVAERKFGSAPREASAEVSAAFLGFVADVVDAPEGSLTSQDAAREIEHLGAESGTVQDFRSVMRVCDDARFGSEASIDATLLRRANTLLSDLIASLKRQGRLS